MASVGRHLVLRVNGVDFLVCVIHEHILGAMLLHTLGGAFAGLVVGALDPALAVGNVSRPAAIGRHGESGCKESRRRQCCKTYFHSVPPGTALRYEVVGPPGWRKAWHKAILLSRPSSP